MSGAPCCDCVSWFAHCILRSSVVYGQLSCTKGGLRHQLTRSGASRGCLAPVLGLMTQAQAAGGDLQLGCMQGLIRQAQAAWW